MTISTETWYTGYDPYTLEPVFCAKTPKEKLAQRMFFFWYKPDERRAIETELRRIGRTDLIAKLYDKPLGRGKRGNVRFDDKAIGSTYDNPGVGKGAKRKADRFVPKGYGNVGCYDEEKYLNNGRPLGNARSTQDQGAGFFKGKKKKSFNPNFDNDNHNRYGGVSNKKGDDNNRKWEDKGRRKRR